MIIRQISHIHMYVCMYVYAWEHRLHQSQAVLLICSKISKFFWIECIGECFFSVFYLLVGEQLALKTKPILSTFNLCRPPPPRKTPTRTPTPPSVLVNFVSSSQNENIDCINSRRSRISRTRSLAHLLGGRKICVWPSVRPSVQQPVSCLCAPLPLPPCVSVIEQVNVYRFLRNYVSNKCFSCSWRARVYIWK